MTQDAIAIIGVTFLKVTPFFYLINHYKED